MADDDDVADMRSALQSVAWAIEELRPLCEQAHGWIACGDFPELTDFPGQTPVPLAESTDPKMDFAGKYKRREVGWPKRLDRLQEALIRFWDAHNAAQLRLDGISEGHLEELNSLRAGWKVAVRRQLDELAKWLSLTEPQGNRPANLDMLIHTLESTLPPKGWSDATKTLFEFDDQLRALRPTKTPTADSTCKSHPLKPNRETRQR